MPGKPKFNSFGKLGEFLKKQELEAAGKKLVDASKNTAKGSRAKIKIGVVKQVPPKVSKVAVLKETPVELPEFKPYYINGENPNILTPEQQALKADLVKSNQIALANYQRELANRGINTPASHRRVGALAVATNPNAIMAPPEGLYKPTYNSATQEWEGAPLSEWFDLASQGTLPYGPNALWRKWYQPLHDATHSFDILGQNARSEAPGISVQQLGYGLEQMAPYAGVKSLYPTKALETAATTVKGGDTSGAGMNSILRPFRQQYVAPVVTGIRDQQFKSMTPSQAIGTFEDSSFGELDPTRIQSVVKYRTQYDPNYNAALRSMERALQERYSPDLMADYNRLKQYGATNLEEFEQFEHMLNNAYSTSQIVESIKPRTISYPFPASDGNSAIEGYQMVPHLYFNGFGKFEKGGILSAKSGIHIKKANRGKFTDYCGGKVTSACIAKGKASSSPTIRKRATFAANSRKWARKHDNGGKFLNWWKREN